MNILDLLIAVVLVLGAIRGYHKGFFHEVATLAALVAGVFIAILASSIIAGIAENLFSWNTRVVQIVAFVLVFILVAGLIRLLGSLLTQLFKALMLGFVNKLAGFFVGMLKWALIAAILIMVIDFFDHDGRLIAESLREGSSLYPLLESLYTRIIERMDMAQIQENFFHVTL